jgi:ribosome-associated toxin RatA of RatAB toxin-antitoxin module
VRRVRPDRVERVVAAPPEACFAVVSDIERYPDWLTGVQAIEVRERDDDGQVSLARVRVRLSLPAFSRELAFSGRVEREPPRRLRLRREPSTAASSPETVAMTWTVAPEGGGSRVGLELEAEVDAPRLVPLGPVGDALARSFADALARRL